MICSSLVLFIVFVEQLLVFIFSILFAVCLLPTIETIEEREERRRGGGREAEEKQLISRLRAPLASHGLTRGGVRTHIIQYSTLYKYERFNFFLFQAAAVLDLIYVKTYA